MKTEWFNQFNFFQKLEIKLGIKANIDVSWYANPEFGWGKMDEIRLGLEENIDVSQYANPTFTLDKMEKIRRKLLKESTL